ncbi:hypothetical protein FGO68_gene13242 [Halteria grandinella]|uniref:Uncharacterized protein n=1 Tax=Halteria grandinella TaxID=5974 RepID=A0A8J8SU26_HALGN|nr:hypothetical protein FGO68_gene13242 [Halteria grandinella]
MCQLTKLPKLEVARQATQCHHLLTLMEILLQRQATSSCHHHSHLLQPSAAIGTHSDLHWLFRPVHIRSNQLSVMEG